MFECLHGIVNCNELIDFFLFTNLNFIVLKSELLLYINHDDK